MKMTLKQLKRKRQITERSFLAIGALLFSTFLFQLHAFNQVTPNNGIVKAVSIVGQTQLGSEKVYLTEDSRGETYLVPVSNTNSFSPYAEIQLQDGNWEIKKMFPPVNATLS